jgi:flagellar capping protein FliD
MEKSIDARFEKVENEIKDLRGDMKDLRGEVNTRFEKMNDKMDSHFKWMMGFLVGAVLIPIALQYFTK